MDHTPLSLKLFLNDLKQLKPPNQSIKEIEKISDQKFVGISEKKVHEIHLLAPVIDEICKYTECDLVIDIGSGLGYLSHMLHQRYGYQVLGLEMSHKFVEQAYNNQNKFYSRSKGHVIFSKLFIDVNSVNDIHALIEHHFGLNRKVCFTGLHACADLSVTVLKLFSTMDNVRALAIMPCCYHRISTQEDHKNNIMTFPNFPCSNTLRKPFEEMECTRFLQIPFLRLACQDSLDVYMALTEVETKRKLLGLMFRAILEDVAKNENCSPRRLKRKSPKSNDAEDAFEAYLNNLPGSHALIAEPSTVTRAIDKPFLEKMRAKWSTVNTERCRGMVEALTAFQAVLQVVCENVVLLDRVEFVRERGFRCNVRRITDRTISPRCWALIADKKNL
ncbi:hypothetical protein GWI33_001083 [Rhynchophorus ferrugineus]|uniref:Methyltransferase domain-containing protein n=1 Tax=Rhynchophorus ferrugineus TaxID=354439 RepID=A0A834IZE4_RHYFE|nr:hypothetical protein GWI33_001083 [Rhynchophorus ferrugineus]